MSLQYIKTQSKNIIREAFKKLSDSLKYADLNLLDEEFLIELAEIKANAAQFVPEEKQTEDFCLACVKVSGTAIQYCKKQNPEICRIAVENSGIAIKDCFPEFITPDLEKLALEKTVFALRYVSQTPELCYEIVNKNPKADTCIKQTKEILEYFYNKNLYIKPKKDILEQCSKECQRWYEENYGSNKN